VTSSGKPRLLKGDFNKECPPSLSGWRCWRAACPHVAPSEDEAGSVVRATRLQHHAPNRAQDQSQCSQGVTLGPWDMKRQCGFGTSPRRLRCTVGFPGGTAVRLRLRSLTASVLTVFGQLHDVTEDRAVSIEGPYPGKCHRVAV
jgi:hypothetical protein